MNKKQYITPRQKTVKMKTFGMLAFSATMDGSQTISSSDDFGARENSFDDDFE